MIAWLAAVALAAQAESAPPPEAPAELDTDAPGAVEEVVVEASRMRLTVGEMPVNTTVLSEFDVRESAWQPADQILRQVPGFSLLRSADSIAAAPTTTTASLRGLGGSAASRTLVLLDGLPIHGPFTTEIYWARVPRHRIDHVEVIRGGGANAWGNLSLGGVVNIVTGRPERSGWAFDGLAGYPATVDLAAAGHYVTEDWRLDGDIDWYDTDGYLNLPKAQQGPVDEPVRKEHGRVSARLEGAIGQRSRGWLRAAAFSQEREGGSALDIDEIDIVTVAGGIETRTRRGDRLQFQAFYEDAMLEDASVRILGDNEAEILRGFEERPTEVLGVGLVWTLPSVGAHEIVAGADYRWADVRVDEYGRYNRGAPLELLTTRSRQDMGGVFIQDHWRIGDRWQVDGSLRWDYVVNSASNQLTALLTGTPVGQETFPENDETTLNGNLGARFRAGENVSLRAAAYSGFRAPTLRELYHVASTRGGVVLVNNPLLEPERLVGFEAGVDFDLGAEADLRLTLFRNTVEDLVQNITRGSTGDAPGIVEPCGLLAPNETCRELDNVGEMRATGLEVEAGWRPGDNWQLGLSYLFNDTEITEAPDNPALEGNRVRQAPRHSFTARLRFLHEAFDASLLARYVGERYEDDLNHLEVDDFLLFDLRVALPLAPGLELFLAVENLLDEEYEVRLENSGALEIGRPRFVGLGLHFRR